MAFAVEVIPQMGLIYKEVARDRLYDPLATLQLEKVPIPDQISILLSGEINLNEMKNLKFLSELVNCCPLQIQTCMCCRMSQN
jgi:hypothetical protein